MFMDMDKMVGADFERGLAALKTQAESASKDAARNRKRRQIVSRPSDTPSAWALGKKIVSRVQLTGRVTSS